MDKKLKGETSISYQGWRIAATCCVISMCFLQPVTMAHEWWKLINVFIIFLQFIRLWWYWKQIVFGRKFIILRALVSGENWKCSSMFTTRKRVPFLLLRGSFDVAANGFFQSFSSPCPQNETTSAIVGKLFHFPLALVKSFYSHSFPCNEKVVVSDVFFQL